MDYWDCGLRNSTYIIGVYLNSFYEILGVEIGSSEENLRQRICGLKRLRHIDTAAGMDGNPRAQNSEVRIFLCLLIFINIYWLHKKCTAFCYTSFPSSHKSQLPVSSHAFERRTTYWRTLSKFSCILLIASQAPKILCTKQSSFSAGVS